MLRRRLYYILKPYIPWGVRVGVRGWFARRKRRTSKGVWPIDEAARRTPEGWPGWPEGKKFAFVITHDVEGPDGLKKCRQLAELEMQMGFRSSFNFIPEGSYTVPEDLRQWLKENGFEVGVHDLNHDGKLFDSRNGFKNKALRINDYLRDWGAVGFRAGFMLRNLEWYHDLDIDYDLSTFDTDPFEPMPDGAGTIFPFWVPAPTGQKFQVPSPKSQVIGQTSDSKTPPGLGSETFDLRPETSPSSRSLSPSLPHGAGRRGYVELPYSLPQDSTLFFVLGEKTPEIWLRKLDWVVAHGGMALVNVHPDYLCFDAERPSPSTFPITFYSQLLQYVSLTYAGKYLNTTPRNLVNWAKENALRLQSTVVSPSAPTVATAESLPTTPKELRGKRAAVMVYSVFPADCRVHRAALAMIEAGMQVDLLCISETESDARREVVDGVNVFRLPIRHRRDSKLSYLLRYGRFSLSSFWFLTHRSLRRRYDIVHCHNMPDSLVFAALIPKLQGAGIVLDLHDPMPELMMSIYGLNPAHLLVRFLRVLERWSIGFSDIAVTPNITFKDLFVSRGCCPDKMQIVMNSPPQEIFNPGGPNNSHAHGDDRKGFRIMHHGLIAHRHGVDLLVEAIAKVRLTIPNVHLDIFGDRTPFLDTVLEVARRLDVADHVHFHGVKTQMEIAQAIRTVDLGVVPNRRSQFTELNLPTRIFEYLAMRCPVIAPATQGIKDYFDPEELVMFEPGNVEDLAAKILWTKDHPDEANDYVERGLNVYRDHLWPKEKARFLDLIAPILR